MLNVVSVGINKDEPKNYLGMSQHAFYILMGSVIFISLAGAVYYITKQK